VDDEYDSELAIREIASNLTCGGQIIICSNPGVIFQFIQSQISIHEAARAWCMFPSAASLVRQIQQLRDKADARLPDFPSARRSRQRSHPWTAAGKLRLLVAVALSPNFEPMKPTAVPRFGPGDLTQFADCEEARQLRGAVERLGTANWSQVAKSVTGGTDLQCGYRYLHFSKQESSMR
jgi:hypothetical protein